LFEATPTLDAPPAAERPGTVIGPYKLLQQIGEGGMGVVWMAEQTEPVKRKVALKVIKPGMDSRQVVARFEAERQALAMMDHVNIARVFDGGDTESSRHTPCAVASDGTRSVPATLGRPYFVMELVHGVPITKYCDDNHLTPRERLELFVPVCQAIQHAHQTGIIHRDIKPSDVMVTLYDGKPVPKVIDFGVAKATEQKLTERTLFTQYGTMVGTLEYMSPEQAEMSALGVDTRSDIYSLGVLLYELLTGSTPLTHKRMKEAAYAEILRMIKEEEPPKPSTRLSDSGEALASISANRHTEPAKLTKLVRGELDWIVMKTLEKDRSRRYETANAFAADVQRYLNDEPVQACPPSVGYRLRKFARRNKAGLAVAGLVLAFLVTLGAGAGWVLRDRAAREQMTEEGIRQALDRAGNSLGELHATLKKKGGVHELLNQPARWELFLKTAQAELTQARRLMAGAEGKLDAEVAQAVDRLEQRLAGDEADYHLALRLEKIRLDTATWVKDRFDFRTAAQEYPKAFAGFEVLTRNPETAAARLEASPIKEQLAAALGDWAYVAHKSNDKRLLERLLAVAREAGPDPAWGDRLRRAEVWDNQMELARLAAEAPAASMSPQLLNLVGSLMNTGRPHQVEWRRRAQARHPADFWLAFELGNAVSHADPAEATLWFRVALAIRPTNSAAYSNLGIAFRGQKKLPEATAAYQKAIELDPKNAYAHNGLGLVFAEQRKFEEAIAAYHKAIEFGPHAWIYVNLGDALFGERKLDEAVAAYHEAIKLDGRDAVAYAALGQALRFQKRLDDAVAAYREAIDIDPKYAVAYDGLGCALCQQGKFDEAIANFWEAIKLNPNDHVTWANLHDAYHAAQKLDDAIAAYDEAIKRYPDNSVAYYFLGNALRAQKKLPQAIAAYEKAIELNPKFAQAHNNLALILVTWSDAKLRDPGLAVILAKKADELDPQNWRYISTLGMAHYRTGDWKAAIAALEKSMALRKGGDSIDGFFLAMAHWQLGAKDKAREWYDWAVKWMDKNQPTNEQLRRFRAEAAELLGLNEKK
jgi:serine/threonine protein kinase/tetratricopeptide (TPR) repeat protein